MVVEGRVGCDQVNLHSGRPQVPRAPGQHHHHPLTSRRAQPDCLRIHIMSSPVSLFLVALLAASRAFAAPQDGQVSATLNSL